MLHPSTVAGWAQLALHRTSRELHALYARLPRYAVPVTAWTDQHGTIHPAGTGWSEADHVAVEALLDRERELRAGIAAHPAWAAYEEPPIPAPRPRVYATAA
ncbi:hypothetical protein QMK19_19390 [Streptomyces sp. H10-C2]|uniref:hypothetical protein n=1 Tax=unclassified Streptomyces TaxID=2593676 RepID=UPI0024BAF92B|nr:MULTISPECIES: hypothetical protein [unclassified Streptomyces]MDJ0343407.1 hypothetical protein [Streptomyces sp. PH10-H1]MDJ0371782.1 hypothetical protein [Streptomyces sp. H10-C2]